MIEENPLSGLEPARTPSELRDHVLRAARNALVQAKAAPTTWELLWRSRALRWSWTAACTLLVAGHMALTLWPRRPPGESERLIVAPTFEPSSELRDELYLPSIERLAAVIENNPPAPGEGLPAGVNRKGQG